MSNHDYLPISSDPPSLFGVASLATGVAIAALMTILVLVGVTSGFSASEIAGAPLAWRVGMWAGFGAAMVGIVLGIVGLFHADHSKTLAVAGLATNALVFIAVGLLVGLGVVGI